MSATAALTRHAHQRITERVVPIAGDAAFDAVEEIVLDAMWNHRWRRTPPTWARMEVQARGSDIRYATGWCNGQRLLVVVALDERPLPVVVTVVTDATGARPKRALAPLPVLACGRVIGLPRTRDLPVAFAA